MSLILVVDDDQAVRDSLKRSLEYNGYEVSAAEDGVQALARLAATRPDAVIMDVMMPRLDGLETTRMLRAAGNDVPILVLTARDALAAARDEQMRRRTIRDLTEERWQRFHRVVGHPTCPYCQQTLSTEYACQLQQKMELDRADAHRLDAQAERELLTATVR